MSDKLARALRIAIGGELKRSGLGHVWRDDATWRELAGMLTKALSGDFVLIDRATYKRLVADAEQMRTVRRYVEEYRSRLDEKKKRATESPYARWAAENTEKK